ncbi:50S ribosomal protein L10 [Buchnera aphidicola]|uniref:50S ribosomal protein L10 n=1 Tax=Buchnera aphidicola TaxID=9 RepID=UPI00094C2885|nr:50S ribosomal protein L10 [Buchnera aphidicola]
MALTRTKKQDIIKKMHHVAKKALSVVTANPSGITVNEINTLRKKAKISHVEMHIIRNTLLKKSLENTHFDTLQPVLSGPTLIAFSMNHPGSASRLFKLFNKQNNQFQIKNAVYERRLLNLDEIHDLADLPTHQEAIIKFIWILKEITLGKLLRALYQLKHN